MSNAQPNTLTETGGITIEQYASANRLSLEFLRKLGLTQVYIGGVPAIKIPYLDEDSAEVAVRFRHSLNGSMAVGG